MEITSLQQIGAGPAQQTGSAQLGTAPSPAAAVADRQGAPGESGDRKLETQEAAKVANSVMDSLSLSLNFSVDHDLGKVVVKVMDSATKEVIKQIPSEEMLAIARALDKLQGLLVQAKA